MKINFSFLVDQELLDEISDNEIEDIEDNKKESEDEIMEADDEDPEEFDGEMTEDRLAEIKVIILIIVFLINSNCHLFILLFSVNK